jgi:type IV pilus assembly protein PilE
MSYNHNMSRSLHKRQAGFTLVELLIAIIVISILAGISMYAYIQILKRAHDDRREDDLIIIQTELEKYFDRNQEYPPGCPDASCSAFQLTDNTSSLQVLNSTSTIPDVISLLPGVPLVFGDPSTSDALHPFMNITNATKAYFYYGGTVNNHATATSLAYGSTANFPCAIQSYLEPGAAGSYVIGYYSEVRGQWTLHGGKNGTPMTVTGGSPSNGCVINKS